VVGHGSYRTRLRGGLEARENIPSTLDVCDVWSAKPLPTYEYAFTQIRLPVPDNPAISIAPNCPSPAMSQGQKPRCAKGRRRPSIHLHRSPKRNNSPTLHAHAPSLRSQTQRQLACQACPRVRSESVIHQVVSERWWMGGCQKAARSHRPSGHEPFGLLRCWRGQKSATMLGRRCKYI
jgi:hypothetical protein